MGAHEQLQDCSSAVRDTDFILGGAPDGVSVRGDDVELADVAHDRRGHSTNLLARDYASK